MQIKHLIIFAVVGMVMLLGFNVMNGSQREKNREVIAASSEKELADTAVSENKGSHISDANASDTSNIASEPLGQQPKALLDDATTKIDQAQQADAARLEQMSPAEQ